MSSRYYCCNSQNCLCQLSANTHHLWSVLEHIFSQQEQCRVLVLKVSPILFWIVSSQQFPVIARRCLPWCAALAREHFASWIRWAQCRTWPPTTLAGSCISCDWSNARHMRARRACWPCSICSTRSWPTSSSPNRFEFCANSTRAAFTWNNWNLWVSSPHNVYPSDYIDSISDGHDRIWDNPTPSTLAAMFGRQSNTSAPIKWTHCKFSAPNSTTRKHCDWMIRLSNCVEHCRWVVGERAELGFRGNWKVLKNCFFWKTKPKLAQSLEMEKCHLSMIERKVHSNRSMFNAPPA